MMSKKRIFAITTVILFVTPIVGFIQFEVLDTKDTPQYLLDAGYTLYCDERFLQVPTNCRLENEQREQITDEIIIRDMIRGRPPTAYGACWWGPTDGHQSLPCGLVGD